MREEPLKSTIHLADLLVFATELSKNNSRNRSCRFYLGTIYLFPDQRCGRESVGERNVAGETKEIQFGEKTTSY